MGDLSTHTFVFVCIMGVLTIFMAVSFLVSYFIAKKCGIILVKPVIDKQWYFFLVTSIIYMLIFIFTICTNSHYYSDLLNDFKNGGIDAYAEYIGTRQLKFDTTEEEREFFDGKIAEYEELALKERRENLDDNWRTGVCFAAYLCLFLFKGVYVTKSGLMSFCRFKPRKFTAKIDAGGDIYLYIDKVSAPQLKLRASEENHRRLSEFIVKGEVEKPEAESLFDYQETI